MVWLLIIGSRRRSGTNSFCAPIGVLLLTQIRLIAPENWLNKLRAIFGRFVLWALLQVVGRLPDNNDQIANNFCDFIVRQNVTIFLRLAVVCGDRVLWTAELSYFNLPKNGYTPVSNPQKSNYV